MDQVVFGADAREYLDVIARMQSKLDELANRTASSHERSNVSWLKGERRVKSGMAELVRDVASGGSAMDALAASAYRIGESIKGGLAFGVGIGVGFAVITQIRKQLEETEKAYKAVQKEVALPISIEANLAPEDIAARIDAVTKATEELKKQRDSLGEKVLEFFHGPLLGSRRPEQDAQIEAGQKREEELSHKRADAELRVVAAKEQGLHVSERAGALAKIEADEKNRLAKLALEQPITQKNSEDVFKRQDAIKRDAAAAKEAANQQFDLADRAKQHAVDLLEIEKRGLSAKDEALQKLESEVDYRKQILDLSKNFEDRAKAALDLDEARLAVLKKQREVAAEARKEAEAYAKAAKDAQVTITPGQLASERRTQRSENKREKELKDQLSREGDPEKRADIKDELAEIQQARADRAQKKQDQEAKQRAAEQQAAEAAAKAQREAQEQAEKERAAKQKASDQSEVDRFGRVLSPQERQQAKFQDDEVARQKRFQDEGNARQQAFADQVEAAERGVTPEQVRNEREAKAKAAEEQQQTGEDQGQDFSSIASLSGADFSSLASLAAMDFSGLEPLNGLTITIA